MKVIKSDFSQTIDHNNGKFEVFATQHLHNVGVRTISLFSFDLILYTGRPTCIYLTA